MLSIKSVYDFDGVDTATPNISSLRGLPASDPRRIARFIRIEKPVSMPDRDVRNIANAAFGVTGYMREILGYAPVEPDGSVKIKVPANVAFQFSITDVNGRRISPVPHRTGCSCARVKCASAMAVINLQHRRTPSRTDAAVCTTPVNPGAPQTGQPLLPAAGAVTISPDQGETMAQARARQSCSSDMRPLRGDEPEHVALLSRMSGRTRPSAPGSGHHQPELRRHRVQNTGPDDSRLRARRGIRCAGRSSTTYTNIQQLWDRDRFVDANGDGTNVQDGAGVDHQPQVHDVPWPRSMPQRWRRCLQVSSTSLLSLPTKNNCNCARTGNCFLVIMSSKLDGGALQDRLVPGPNDADRKSDDGGCGCGPISHRRHRTRRPVGRVPRPLCAWIRQHSCGLSEPSGTSLAVRVAGYWGTVLQQSVRPCSCRSTDRGVLP